MPMRSFLFAAAALALGGAVIRSLSGRASPAPAQAPAPAQPAPAASASVASPQPGPANTAEPADHADLLSDGQPALAALEAGMPRDRHSDADEVRPGFADYARGA